MKNDHRSKFSNLSNWKEEAWKKSRLQRDSNPWPPRYRCDALLTTIIYCDDHSSLWSTTAVQIYELFHINFTWRELSYKYLKIYIVSSPPLTTVLYPTMPGPHTCYQLPTVFIGSLIFFRTLWSITNRRVGQYLKFVVCVLLCNFVSGQQEQSKSYLEVDKNSDRGQ